MKQIEMRLTKLGDMCEKPQYGYTASAQQDQVGPKFLRITDLREGLVDWDTVPFCKADETDIARYWLRHGDVLVARIGATTGSTSIVVEPPPSVFASYLIRLRPTHEMHSYFLYFYTKSEQFRQWIDAHKGSNLKGGVNVPVLLSAPLTLPSFREQEKIAAVLWKLQRAIATQDRLIAATRDLKQSAMQRLFTYGLRGEALKETEIGLRPVNWRIDRFDSFSVLQRGFDLPMAERTKGDIPVVGSNGIVGWHNVARVGAPAVVTGRSGSIGDSNYIDVDCWPLNTSLYVSNFRGNFPLYIHYFLQWFDLSRFKGGVSVPTLNRNMVHGSPVAIPDPDEQRDIAAALATIDRKLAHHQRKRAALNDLFQTTLHQLMTAQIRVADLDIDTSEVSP